MIPRPPTSLSETDIRCLVTRFYAEARQDPKLGPMFEQTIAANAWPAHLDRMVSFWGSVLLATGTYRGNPAARHALLPGLTADHFARWLALFEAAAHEVLRANDAEHVTRLAKNMGKGLQRTVLNQRTGPTTGQESSGP